MNSVDIFLLLPFTYAAVRGFIKGFVIEVFSFIALVVAIIATLKLTHVVMDWLKEYTGDGYWLPFVSYMIVFVAVFFLVLWVGKAIEAVVKIAALGLFNRLAGVLLGLLKMSFLASLVFWLADMVHLLPEHVKEQSIFYSILHSFAPAVIGWVVQYLPFLKDLVEQIEQFFNEIPVPQEGVEAML